MTALEISPVTPPGRWWHGARASGEAAHISPGALPDAEWFRLVPSGPELAAEGHVARSDRSQPPRARRIVVDAKIVPPLDLLDHNFAPLILCSRTLLEALVAAGARGWTARAATHATRRRVAGHPVYELAVRATVGRFVDTAFHAYRRPRADVPRWGRVGAPVSPVTLEASSHSLLVGWTEYVEVDDVLPWRALIIHRRVAEELVKRWRSPLPLEPIAVRSAPTQRRSVRRSSPSIPRLTRLGGAPNIDALCRRLRASAVEFDHLLPPPPNGGASAVREAMRTIGLPARSPLVRLLADRSGPILFGGSLAFCPVGKRDVPRKLLARRKLFDLDDLVREQRHRSFARGGVDVPDGWVIFARGYGGQIYWTMNAEGLVRGYGMSDTGLEYGPEAPFERWLADQMADLELAWTCRGKPWADTMLGT